MPNNAMRREPRAKQLNCPKMSLFVVDDKGATHREREEEVRRRRSRVCVLLLQRMINWTQQQHCVYVCVRPYN